MKKPIAKLIITFVAILVVFCCWIFVDLNRNNGNGNGNVEKQLHGRWLLTNTRGFNCNACPEIGFNLDGTGILIKPSKEQYEFNYKVLSNTLELTFMQDENVFNGESEFNYEFEDKNELRQFRLTSKTKNNKYIMHRSF